jgi:hypothetical protein
LDGKLPPSLTDFGLRGLGTSPQAIEANKLFSRDLLPGKIADIPARGWRLPLPNFFRE